MEPHRFPYQRVIVVGSTGAGKSRLAEKLSQKFGLEFVELDGLHWLPNWQHLAEPDFRARVEAATRGPCWAVAGNYSASRDLTWPRAQAIIWLDYPFLTIFGQLWRRTWRRWRSQELLWGTNRENFWSHLKIWSPEESLFRWLFDTYWRRKREFPLIFARPENAHLKIIHLHTPQETEAWLENLQGN
jgi:adenylate kinase family enzyme